MHILDQYKGKTMNAKNKYIKYITGKERKLLKKIYKKCQGKTAYRSQIILLATDVTKNYTVKQIAGICQCVKQTVYNTFEIFNKEGISGLSTKLLDIFSLS